MFSRLHSRVTARITRRSSHAGVYRRRVLLGSRHHPSWLGQWDAPSEVDWCMMEAAVMTALGSAGSVQSEGECVHPMTCGM